MRFDKYLTEALRNLPFYNNCVNWNPREQAALGYIIDEGEDISRKEFVRATDEYDREELEKHLGYDRHFKIEKDWHVTYERVPGFDCVYMTHSAIEHVFATPQTIKRIQKKAKEIDEVTSGAGIGRGAGQYFTPEEEKLFGAHTKESLNKLLEMGWKIEFKQPSESGTLYRLWKEGRSRALFIKEK